MKIVQRIEKEIDDYLNGSVEVSEGVRFSQHRLVRRIRLFENQTYPTGKVTKSGEYKYWFDIIGKRVNDEKKNLRVDSKDVLVWSPKPRKDFAIVAIGNAALRELIEEEGLAEQINEDIERFSGHGNILWKRTEKGYEATDPMNTYIINQTARTIHETPIIERHTLTKAQLAAKRGIWTNVDEVVSECRGRHFSATKRSAPNDTTLDYYEVFERNGEITEEELFEAQGKEGGDPDRTILAKVVVAGLSDKEEDERFVLFAEEIDSMDDVYREAHRGPYRGRWWREGLYELLFDIQVRANEVGNTISRGLRWSGMTIFAASDVNTFKSVLTDMRNGEIIRSADIRQIQVRMQGFDQLAAEWNRLMRQADEIANSYEIVSGESLPSGTPFRLGVLLNRNSSKLFVLLRQKFTIPMRKMYQDWLLRSLIENITRRDVIRLSGDDELLRRIRRMQAEQWFARNAARFGVAGGNPDFRDEVITRKAEELLEQEPVIGNAEREAWRDAMSRLRITIAGENYELASSLESIANLIQFEPDPNRRAWLLDRVYALKGIPVPELRVRAPSGVPGPEAREELIPQEEGVAQ